MCKKVFSSKESMKDWQKLWRYKVNMTHNLIIYCQDFCSFLFHKVSIKIPQTDDLPINNCLYICPGIIEPEEGVMQCDATWSHSPCSTDPRLVRSGLARYSGNCCCYPQTMGHPSNWWLESCPPISMISEQSISWLIYITFKTDPSQELIYWAQVWFN